MRPGNGLPRRTYPQNRIAGRSHPYRLGGSSLFEIDPEVIMAKLSPFKFFQEVRAEADKVTWPTRRETMISTGMVFVMVILAAIFFFVVE